MKPPPMWKCPACGAKLDRHGKGAAPQSVSPARRLTVVTEELALCRTALANHQTTLSEVDAELNKHGAPSDQRPQGRIRAWVRAMRVQADQAAHAPVAAPPPQATTYRKLPPERASVTRKIAIRDHDLYVTVGLFEDGTPGEVFLKMSKQGSTLSGLIDAVAIAVSRALKHGASLEELISDFKGAHFEPAGWTGSEELGYVSSPVDAAFRWIAKRFLPKPPSDGEPDGGSGSPDGGTTPP